MANSRQARKRARQAEKHRQHNASQRSMVRTYIKRVLAAVATPDHAEAMTAFQKASSVIDKMVHKGIYPKNRAARYKKRLNAKVKAIAA